MKLKGKLILSCAALAAVATTGFSTTYAWYVSNSTVTADGVTAGTTQGGSDTLQISADGLNWNENNLHLGLSTATLTPVSYGADGKSADGTYKAWNDGTNAVGGNAATTAYFDFNLYFRNIAADDTSLGEVYLNQLVVTNTTTGGAPATQALTPVGLYAAANQTAEYLKQHPTYKMDLLKSLKLEIISSEVTFTDDFVGYAATDAANKLANNAAAVEASAAGATPKVNAQTAASAQVLDLDSYATAYDYISGTTNAHKYYNAFKGLTGAAAIDEYDHLAGNGVTGEGAIAGYNKYITGKNMTSLQNTKAGSVLLGHAKQKKLLKTTWRVFINGWDLECFDAMKGQTVTFAMNFDTLSTATE